MFAVMARRINAPGIEVNEIDRSQYGGNVDNSTVGTATLVLGFGDKGDDYNVKWINNMDTFVNNYGNPTNDAERYFYNAVYEVVNGGGVCYTAKLPYYNDSVGNFVYTSYTVDSTATQISSPVSIVSSIYIPEFDLEDLLFFPQDITCDVPGLTSTTLCALVNDESLDFELPAVNSFVAYVKSAANFQVDNQQYLDKHLSTSLGRRTATALFHEILDFTSPDYADPEVSAFVNGCRQSLVDAFGDDITIEGMVERYMGLLYLHEFKEFLSDSINALSIDNPFGELTSLLNTEYTDFAVVDDSLTSYATISADISSKNEIMSYENYDKFIIKELPVPKNKIYIVD